jgi:acyl carrier protein
MLESRLQEELAQVLRIPPSQVGRSEPLQSFGLDSISAVELRNRWQEELGLILPPTLIWDHPSISALATYLAAKIDTPKEDALPAGATQPVPDAGRAAVVAQIKTLSEDEAEKLLLQKLSSIEAKRGVD